MAALIIIAKNQTASPIVLENFDLTLPASPGTYTLTDILTTTEIFGDPQLQDLVATGQVVLNDGTQDLSATAASSVGHGVQTDPTLHATATTAQSGFMAPADKQKADNYPNQPSDIEHSSLNNMNSGDGGHTNLQLRSEKGMPNGYPSLDGSGKVPITQLNLPPTFTPKGTWDADTNTPTLVSGVGVLGDLYRVSVSGNTNLNGITDWVAGDNVWFDGTAWQKDDNTDSVTSVNGQTGAAVLAPTDLVPAGDAAGTARPPTIHKDNHLLGGTDEIDGDHLGITFNPVNYTPDTSIAEATNVDHLAAHLAGIDDRIQDLLNSESLFSGYDNTGGTVINPGPITVPYGARYILVGGFFYMLGFGDVKVPAGKWLVDGDISIDNAVSTSRTVVQCWLEVDAGSGFVEHPGTRCWTYNRISSAGEETAHFGIVLDLADSAVIRVRAQRISGTASCTLLDEGSRLRIFSVIGPEGPQGPAGTAGITFEDDGATVAGGPHDRLNVTGVLTSVVDAGSNEATLDVRLPFYASAKNDATQTTTGRITALTLNFTTPRAGTYQINYSAEVFGTAIGAYQLMEVELDGADIAFIEIPVPRINTTENWPCKGFDVQTLTAGAHTVTVFLEQRNATGSAQIRRIRVSVEEKA